MLRSYEILHGFCQCTYIRPNNRQYLLRVTEINIKRQNIEQSEYNKFMITLFASVLFYVQKCIYTNSACVLTTGAL